MDGSTGRPDKSGSIPWRQRPGIVLVGYAGVAVLFALGIVIVTIVRGLVEAPPKPDPVPVPVPSPQPTVLGSAPADALGTALQDAGMVCVRANDAPVINHCTSSPTSGFGTIRWITDTKAMTGFRIDATVHSTGDKRQLDGWVRRLHVAGLAGSDENKIIKAMVTAKRDGRATAHAGWGSVKIEYDAAAESYAVAGRKTGGRPTRYPGKVFDGTTREISERLEARGFDCTRKRSSVECSKGDLRVAGLGDAAEFRGITVLHTYPRGRQSDDAVVDLLPVLVGSENDKLHPMMVDNLNSSFFLIASGGYLVSGSAAIIMIECVSF